MLKQLAVSALAILLVGNVVGQDLKKTETAAPPKQAQSTEKRTLTTEDYKMWERLRSVAISNDGRYLMWQVGRVDGDTILNGRKVDGPEKFSVPNGAAGQFSDSSRWLAYLIGLKKDETDKLLEQGRPVPTKLGIRDMESGAEQIFEDIQGYQFLKDKDALVAVRAKMTPGPGGNDVLIINAAGGEPSVISNVALQSISPDGKLMAMRIAGASGYNSLQIYNFGTGQTTTLYTGKDNIGVFAWSEKNNVLVTAIARVDEKRKGNNHRLWRFSGIDQGSITRDELDPEKFEGFPKDTRISETSGISVSDDGSTVLFGLQPWTEKPKPVNPKDVVPLQIWNSKDVRVIPRQLREAVRDRNRGAMYVWSPGAKKIVNVSRLKDGEVPGFGVGTTFSRDLKTAFVSDQKPYLSSVTNGTEYEDFYALNVETGEKSLIAKKNQFGLVPSNLGKFAAYYQDKSWWVYDVETKKATPLRPEGKYNFESSQDDRSVDIKQPAGFPIWFDEDAAVMVSDDFDAWMANPKTGKMTRLTDGRNEKLKFSFLDVTPYEDYPKLASNYYFTMFDIVEKRMGFFISDGKGDGKPAMFDNADFSGLVKAKGADRMMFTMESFQKSPDVYVTNEAMTAAKPVTRTNPQQRDFHWGKNELIQFKSRFGAQLQGTLTYPANFDPKKKYPMVTYVYERLSDNQNTYQFPIEWSAYNIQHFSQNGYFVFQPDIVYQGQKPGQNAVDCLEPALEAAMKKEPAINAAKVGLIGHSWGAYQTAFVTTVSNKFAVGACGAPLTELTSMYSGFYWNSGTPSGELFETGQGRMKVPFWDDPKGYMENSPVWNAAKRKVPLLMAFGDNDGAVDWSQGQYMYNTLRRMGKECVLLLYAGENHNFRLRPNQLDYAKRLRHYLDVYLKGEKAEAWVTEGVPYIKQTDK